MPSKNSKGESYGKGRTRNYATVVYPDSAPENWQSILADQFVPAFISPLHDKDLNATGEPKKAHFHVLIMFDSVKTEEQAKDVFEQISGVGCEVVKSLRGYARYLCHLDNPDKVQYDTALVRSLCGADYDSVTGLPIDRYKCIGEMMDFCDDNGIIYYSDLIRICRQEHYAWFKVLCDSGTYVMKEYLKSESYKNRSL